ncbi:sugar phosphate isomerase/epimerase family protein [Roseibium aggregatum]|uniref:Sugar phosphate isomerase/epimerase n=1 Tax=Roseibium aggregatum TaxID=187304 RepID=A0A926S8J6_9HYPH|nr:sugar phosphate isomerase/epimerase family protein [Roseibium aggregatum]MBD1548812.1 sugar phosphate isomerase/epimerase [Roseibium aggregatum]
MTTIGNRFGVNTYSYTQTMTAGACLRHLADEGVEEIELMLFPGHIWPGDSPDAVMDARKALADGGLKLTSINTPNIDLNIAAAAEEMRRASLELNSAFLHLGSDLGAKAMILGPGKPNPLFPLPSAVLEGYFFQALDTLLPLAARLDIEIWIENMPFAFLPDAESLMASLARYGEADLKICYDVANGHFIGEEPVEGLKTVASRLALVHLSDTTRQTFRHDAVGEGDLDFEVLPDAIAAVGHEERPVLEIISRSPERDFPRSVAALKNYGF